MTWYREIEPVQEPFDLGIDQAGFVQVAFNIDAIKNPSNTFLEELKNILETDGVGTYETDIFLTSRAIIPDGDGPYLIIIETGGAFPERVHNFTDQPAFQRPSAQIVVKAKGIKGYADARLMARNAYNALVKIRNYNAT
jgi:hypothetical protein